MPTRRGWELPAGGGVWRNDDTGAFTIALGNCRPEVVAAELGLLREGLVHRLALRHRGSALNAQWTVGDLPSRARARFDRSTLALELSRTELDAWIHLFLRWFRDGSPAVDHLDLEADDADSGGVREVVVRWSR